MFKRILIVITFVLSFSFVYSQDAQVFNKGNMHNELRKINRDIYFHGVVLNFNKNIYIRSRVYDQEFFQLTLIFKAKRFDFRAYEYYSILTGKITPALSIRWFF